MKAFGISVLVGLLVAFGGIVFCDIFGTVFNGMGWDTGRILGMGVYICITLVVCTGLLMAQIKKNR